MDRTPAQRTTSTTPRTDTSPERPAETGTGRPADPPANDARRPDELVALSDAELEFTSGVDIRGFAAVDINDEEIGTIDELLVGAADHKVHLVRLKAGGILGLGEESWLIPVEAITQVGDDAVRVERTGKEVAAGPAYQPKLVLPEDTSYESVYRYYGFWPFWQR